MSERTINVIEPELMLEYALWGAAILLLCTYALFMPLHLVALTFSRLWLYSQRNKVNEEKKPSVDPVETIGPLDVRLGSKKLNGYYSQNGHSLNGYTTDTHALNGFTVKVTHEYEQEYSDTNGFTQYSDIQPHVYLEPQPNHKAQIGVTVIKPLVGYDPNFKVNLESFFLLDYTNYEIIFCIGESHNGPSLPIVKELMALHPSVGVRIFEGGEQLGVNPKINNMLPGYRNAQFNVLWICDSGIKAHPKVLKELTHHMNSDPQIALVHQLPYVAPVNDLVGYLDKVYFGTHHSRMYLLAALANKNCANGMSWLVRKDALEQEGGLEFFKEYLAEDFYMSQALIDRFANMKENTCTSGEMKEQHYSSFRGWKAVLSTLPALQNPGNRSFNAFQSRIKRWCRLRCTIHPFISRLEPFSECLGLGLVGALSSHYLFGVNILLFLSLHIIFWFSCDLALIKSIENGPIGSLWKIAVVWFLREIWTFPIFLGGAFSKEINWRGQHYKLMNGGKAIKLN